MMACQQCNQCNLESGRWEMCSPPHHHHHHLPPPFTLSLSPTDIPTFVAARLLFKIGRKWTCLGSRQMHQGRGSLYLLSALHPGGGESGRMRTDGGQLLAHLLPTFLPLLLFLYTSPLPQHIPSTSPLPLRRPHHFSI